VRPSIARSKSEHILSSIVVCWPALAEISSKPRTYACHSTSKSKRPAISTVSCMCTDRRTLFTMDRHTQFLAPPPISSPLLQHNSSSKYTSYDSLQNPYTPQSTLDSPPFYSNPSSTRPSSTQYHAQAAEPYDPRSFTFDPTHFQPMHKPLSESVPPQFTASPFTPALS